MVSSVVLASSLSAFACCTRLLELLCACLLYGFIVFCSFQARFLLYVGTRDTVILASWTCLLKHTEHSHRSCLDICLLRHMGHCCSRCLDVLASWSHHSCTSGCFCWILSLWGGFLLLMWKPGNSDWKLCVTVPWRGGGWAPLVTLLCGAVQLLRISWSWRVYVEHFGKWLSLRFLL